ncbi:hypothetical protein ACH4YO_01535 [Streptomyces noursei]|uniref:hypothetical protein n=1 Tax=Streptomyces noursei TaxID=1971 RepID=UPI0033D5EFFC
MTAARSSLVAERAVPHAGDYPYIPADTPHLLVNSDTEDMVCLVARTGPDEQEGVRLLALPVWLASRLGPLPRGAG